MTTPQTLDQIAPGGTVQLNDSPGGLDDATFDSLFPAESTSQIVTQTVQQPVTAKPETQQPSTSQPEFFLKGERSVYKSSEDATRGLNEKDALIEQLRQRYALTTGIDPITGKPVVLNGTPQGATDYSTQPDLYLNDLYEAAKKGGPEAYRDVQQKFIMDTVKPLQPILFKAAKDQALETLATELPAAKGFIGTPNYNKALETNPSLKQAISTSEADYRFHHQLPGLYKLAYLTSQGQQLPELLKAQATQTTQTTQQPVRTTVQSTTPSPASSTAQPSFKTIEGIKSVIKDMEGKGVSLNW
jgi:cell division septation protein DedD